MILSEIAKRPLDGVNHGETNGGDDSLRALQEIFGINRTSTRFNGSLVLAHSIFGGNEEGGASYPSSREIKSFASGVKAGVLEMIKQAGSMGSPEITGGVRDVVKQLESSRIINDSELSPIFNQMLAVLEDDRGKEFANEFLHRLSSSPDVSKWKTSPNPNVITEETNGATNSKGINILIKRILNSNSNSNSNSKVNVMVTSEGVTLPVVDQDFDYKYIDLSAITGRSKAVAGVLAAATTYLFFRLSFNNLVKTVEAVDPQSGVLGALGVESLESVLVYVAATNGLISQKDSRNEAFMKKATIWGVTSLIFMLDTMGILYAGYGGLNNEPILPEMPTLISNATKITIAALGGVWPNIGFNLTLKYFGEWWSEKIRKGSSEHETTRRADIV